MNSSSYFARIRLHHPGYIRTRGLKSRRDAENDARQQRKTDAEEQHRQIDADSGFMREGKFWKPVQMSFTRLLASATPKAAPVNDSISASVSNCRRMREPSAPIADRTANSCWRAVPRANNRIETFPQPISSNKATAPSSRYNVPPISATKWSFNPSIATRKCSGKWAGVCFANSSRSD